LGWLFADITETINVAESIWTTIAVLGVLLCVWLSALRTRTLYYLFQQGINGSSRLLSIQRLIRVALLGVVFLLFVIVGSSSLSVPTNPAVKLSDVREAVPALAIMFMEFVLFAKLVIEEILEHVINHMRDMQDAAKNRTTPRLSD
jgi:hypothetical protein